MPFSNYLDSALNKLMWGDTAYSIPANVYVGLSTTTPNADGTNVSEPGAGSYARVTVPNDTSHWHPLGSQPGTGQEQSNVLAITFPTALTSWGLCTYVVIYDALTNGNLLAFGQLTNSQTPTTGDTPSFAVDALTITLT